jgi:hypothetical protein
MNLRSAKKNEGKEHFTTQPRNQWHRIQSLWQQLQEMLQENITALEQGYNHSLITSFASIRWSR